MQKLNMTHYTRLGMWVQANPIPYISTRVSSWFSLLTVWVTDITYLQVVLSRGNDESNRVIGVSTKSSSVSSVGWGSSTLTILSFACFRNSSSKPLLLLHLLPLFLFLWQQFQWDLHNAYFIGSYCEQLPIVCPKSIPKYKYLSASGGKGLCKGC